MHPHDLSWSDASTGEGANGLFVGGNQGGTGTGGRTDSSRGLLCFVWARYTGRAWMCSRGCYRTTEEHFSIRLNYPNVSVGSDDY